MLAIPLVFSLIACNVSPVLFEELGGIQQANVLDYRCSPQSPKDRHALSFSDQGAWFAYGFPTDTAYYGGFSGPFLMTQENGVWCSKALSLLELTDLGTGHKYVWKKESVKQTAYNSHLLQIFEDNRLRLEQVLFFVSGHSAFMVTRLTNLSSEPLELQPRWRGDIFLQGMRFGHEGRRISLFSDKSAAKGVIMTYEIPGRAIRVSDSTYTIEMNDITLQPGERQQLIISHSFIFPRYGREAELQRLEIIAQNPLAALRRRVEEKEQQLSILSARLGSSWSDAIYKELISKTLLTLQNNWRIAAGELKHSGLFPSYHYKWFHGFWAWDSWKQAAALAQYDVALAKEQIKAMYDFQATDGFIPDCVFRDTTIEKHNYRNTKPPLSAWAVWMIYRQSKDIGFLNELYPKVLKQHRWWYENRDYDSDGLCEYGCTDGTLIAAKWESGMDNAVRFDKSALLKNSDTAYSLNQESVDLNAYLFAEKNYLLEMAAVLGKKENSLRLAEEAGSLKLKIQNQFFDETDGWFYDTTIDGKSFIRIMGCEGWIPLWARAATAEQAEMIKHNMMNSGYFFTTVPFPTLNARHEKFDPDRGYWRGPVWLDQAYFAVVGLRKYEYQNEADTAMYALIHNAQGVLVKGKSIREHYNPITGQGLNAHNFSWSAAHYLLLLSQRL